MTADIIYFVELISEFEPFIKYHNIHELEFESFIKYHSIHDLTELILEFELAC